MSVKTESSVADQLRAVRGADDVVARLHEGSIAGKAEKIAALLQQEGVIESVDDLRGVYGEVRCILATNTKGEPIRVHVREEKDTLKIGKVELLEWAQPVADVAEEVLRTATAAADAILKEDYDAAKPMVEAVAQTLDVTGDLNRRVGLELDVASIRRTQWYDGVVAEHYEGEEPDIPATLIDEADGVESVKEAISELGGVLAGELGKAADAFKTAAGRTIDTNILDAARSVVEDMKCAIRALRNVNMDSEREALKVFEGVAEQAPRLVKGTRFVVQLVTKASLQGAEGK